MQQRQMENSDRTAGSNGSGLSGCNGDAPTTGRQPSERQRAIVLPARRVGSLLRTGGVGIIIGSERPLDPGKGQAAGADNCRFDSNANNAAWILRAWRSREPK